MFDPQRLAVDSFRGSFYQLWQSLLAWKDLKPNEALYLEGAEDFDILGSGYAVTNQVKNIKRSVTLQSKPVLEAISNFWKHQKGNSEYVIQFRFLSTAERGLERSRPFGTTKGLDYWDECRGSDANLDLLRAFLGSQNKLPKELREFVKTSSDEELRENLVNRIEWLTGLKQYEQIKDQVYNWAVNYGERIHSLTPRDSQNVVPVLFEYVCDTVSKNKGRRLRYTDLALLFANASKKEVIKSDYDRFRRFEKTG